MINIYDLSKKKIEKENIKNNIYNKVLERCHKKIKLAGNQCQTYTYFVIPEYEFGVPMYNVLSCTNYIIKKLKENHFYVYYTYPNFLIISWGHIEHDNRKELEYENYIKSKNNNNNYINLNKIKNKSLTFRSLE